MNQKINLLYEEFEEYVDRFAISNLKYMTSETFDFRYCSIEDIEMNQDTTFYFVMSFMSKNIEDFANVAKRLRYKNLKIIILNLHEISYDDELQKIQMIIDENNLPNKSIHYVNNDTNIRRLKEKLKLKYNVYNSYALAKLFGYDGYNIEDINTNKSPNKLFYCVNKSIKKHRILFLSLVYKLNLLESVNYSFLNKFEYMSIGDDDLIKVNLTRDNLKFPIKNTDYESSDVVDNGKINFAGLLNVKDAQHSLINLTTESVFFSDIIHISEKSFKPFALFHLPVFVASHNHVKELEYQFGFDLFHDIIDHSYDSEPNDYKRLIKIVEEIKRLNSQKPQLQKIYKTFESRLYANHEIINSLNKIDKDYQTFKKIYNFDE